MSRTVAFFASLFLLFASLSVQAAESENTELIKQLLKRIEELERKVQALEAGPFTNPASTGTGSLSATQQKTSDSREPLQGTLPQSVPERKTALVEVGEKGFLIASSDRAFSLQLRGLLQVDSRTFFGDAGIDGNDGLFLRRARPIIAGTVFRDFDFLVAPEFGGRMSPQIFDAYINYRFQPELQMRFGKFKSPVGLEYLQPDQFTMFSERGLPTYLMPGRDVGMQLHGEAFQGVLSYAAGIFNGLGDARNSDNTDYDDNNAFAGRIFVQPFRRTSLDAIRGIGLGVGGSYEAAHGYHAEGLPAAIGGRHPGYFTPALEQFFAYEPATLVPGTTPEVVATGEHWRISPQAYWFFGPFNLLGEYVVSDQMVARKDDLTIRGDLQHCAWQIAGGWVLTGETVTYGEAIIPKHPFDPRQGGWGAWRVVARYGELRLDDATFPLFSNPEASAREAAEWSLGVDWYLNRNLRFASSFSHVSFTGGGLAAGNLAPEALTRADENVLFTRVQVSF